ncbi:MAG: EAL domain-containing protein [Acetobacteraceae bacterium]|nr:EAL domain-containing protein [Acetobacteraceae bacterium]
MSTKDAGAAVESSAPARHQGQAQRDRNLLVRIGYRLIALRGEPSRLWGKSRLWGRPVPLLMAGQILLGVVLAVATVLLVVQLRDRRLAQAERGLQIQALTLADQAERAIEGVELLQTVLQDHLHTATLPTPAAFRESLSSDEVRAELTGHERTLPQLDALVIVDAAGDVINYSRPQPLPERGINVADRDFFQGLSNHPERTTFISGPIQARSTGKWTMYIAHRIAAPDGTFLGILMGAVELPYFEDLYRAVASDKNSVLALFRKDGRLLARYPHIDLALGQSLPLAYFQALQDAGTSTIVVRQNGRMDGRDRVIAAHALTHYPMVVTVSNTVSAILAEWQRQAVTLGAAAVILELLVAGAGLLMLRQVRSTRMLADARAAQVAAEADLAVAREWARADLALGVQNIRFIAALSNMTQALCMFDQAGRLVVANKRLSEMFDLPADLVTPGASLEALVDELRLRLHLQPHDTALALAHIVQLRAAGRRASYTRQLADGRTLAMNFAPIEDGGWLMTLEDITERRQVEATISHMAHHDTLTGLPNRVLFHDRLAEAVARGRRGEPCAVLYIDLDHFKSVNDTLGHPLGDALLQAVTQRLLAEVRETDTVARLGGDEFAIVQSGVQQPGDSTVLATRLIDALSAPYALDGHRLTIGTSIGIAIAPNDGEDPDMLLKNADMALYRAKSDGRGRYCFFTRELDALMQARRTLEADLQNALEAGEFQLFYQPLMNLKTRSVTGFEALVRWLRPEHGLIQPIDFVPFAEEIGFIVPLGKWVLQRACADAATWPGDIKVAVNVSVIQFGSRTLVDDVAAALQESGLSPSRLELEITETVMVDDTDTVLLTLHRLRDLGVGIAMDDFGTGYSSLSYLRRFPFSKVKIDRSFIEGLGKGADCDAIVTAVIQLCRTLGMIALAEGVETEEQLAMLRAGKCSEAQGYLFSRPRPAAEVEALWQRLGLHPAQPVLAS